MDDPSRRDGRDLRSFALQPENKTTQEEILRLARRSLRAGRTRSGSRASCSRWRRIAAGEAAVARNAAYLVEHEVKDPVRAFRAYLNAFRLAPDDAEISGHLWRLAALIGRYEPAPEISRRSPTGWTRRSARRSPTRPASSCRRRWTAPTRDCGGRGRRTTRPTTERRHASVGERASDTRTRRRRRRGDHGRPRAPTLGDADEATEDVDIADDRERMEAAQAARGGSATRRSSTRSRRRPKKPRGRRRCRRPPPPPRASRAPAEDEPFETPWEELAARLRRAPRRGPDDPPRYLRKIVEVWERGQQDIDRALDALERAFRLDIKANVIVAPSWSGIGGEYDRWDRVVDIYLGAIDEFGPIDTAVALHHDAARLRERLGQTDKAEALYRRDPAPQVRRRRSPWRASRRSSATSSAGKILANVLEKRTSAPTEALPLGPERRARLRELADALRGAPRAPLRGDRHAGAPARRGRPTRSGATARRRRRRRTPRRCWTPTGRWRGSTRASACGPRSSRA